MLGGWTHPMPYPHHYHRSAHHLVHIAQGQASLVVGVVLGEDLLKLRGQGRMGSRKDEQAGGGAWAPGHAENSAERQVMGASEQEAAAAAKAGAALPAGSHLLRHKAPLGVVRL